LRTADLSAGAQTNGRGTDREKQPVEKESPETAGGRTDLDKIQQRDSDAIETLKDFEMLHLQTLGCNKKTTLLVINIFDRGGLHPARL
jgi:hypothetical protein